jgi:hypothetical protein
LFGVEFLEDCRQYYATPVDLQWGLDRDGSYETNGTSVTFDAGALDGPTEVAVPAKAQHPAGGNPGQATARIIVRNVAPALTPLRLTDGAGNEVNVAVPFVLVGLPLTASAGFTDPGLPDRQTAMLDWGDGSVEPHTAFTVFDEAFGDGAGAVSHTHRYAIADSYLVALSVTDDDGDAANQRRPTPLIEHSPTGRGGIAASGGCARKSTAEIGMTTIACRRAEDMPRSHERSHSKQVPGEREKRRPLFVTILGLLLLAGWMRSTPELHAATVAIPGRLTVPRSHASPRSISKKFLNSTRAMARRLSFLFARRIQWLRSK